MQPQRREAAPHQLDFVMRVDDLVKCPPAFLIASSPLFEKPE